MADSMDNSVDGIEDNNDGRTLKEVAAEACKRIDVGSFSPKPLFSPDARKTMAEMKSCETSHAPLRRITLA
jgi:hypothetical protein